MGRVRVLEVLFLVVLVLGMFPYACVFASWQVDGNPICTAASDQSAQVITSDGSGGAIIAWSDDRNGYFDVYARRVDASGNVLWTVDGVAICTLAGHSYDPGITSDGNGGAIIAWRDQRNGPDDIYAQRVDGLGNVMWVANGVAICTAPDYQGPPQLTSDGSGGAIIAWSDGRAGGPDICAQRVNGSGNVLWIANGVGVCMNDSIQTWPQIASDGAGGAIIVWQDYRGGPSATADVYAQRLDASGNAKWAADGVAISTAPGPQWMPTIASDGSGGAIITWMDYRASVYCDIYAQRVDASGNAKWTVNGVAICTAGNYQEFPVSTSDMSGGAIIAWVDKRSGDFQIYAQRADASGNVMWTANGLPVCTASVRFDQFPIISDGSGGAIITWADYRSGNDNIYTQRVNMSGTMEWTANGLAICTDGAEQYVPQFTSDGAGGAIIAWRDERNGNVDIYAHHIGSSACEFTSWRVDGNPVSRGPENQWFQRICSDGLGGAIILLEDHRSGNDDLYAQRMDASGCALWADHGVSICTADSNQWSPQIISDGSGGAFMTWQDRRRGHWDIYAQRVNAYGNVMWVDTCVSICELSNDQTSPQIISDGSGGAIIVWEDYRSYIGWDIYAQRVDGSGNWMWTNSGVAICTAANSQVNPELTPDGSGGAIIAWQDNRTGGSAGWDTYVQRVDASGNVQWTANGVVICTLIGNQINPELTSDGAGGAIMVWQDMRSGSLWDVYAQRVNGLGNVQWTPYGMYICTAWNEKMEPQIISDGSGGAIVTWRDYRSWSNWDIYAQRLDALGNYEWGTNGVAVSTAAGDQILPKLTSDGAGGAIITWQDPRTGTHDIYAQRMDASGTASWTVNGVAICAADSNQAYPELTSDGAGGAIITWEDHRNDDSYDVYAERITVAGTIDVPGTPAAAKVVTGLSQNAPNPFNPMTRITFSVATRGEVSLRIYDIAGRVLRTLVQGWREAGVYSEVWDGRSDDGSVLPSGVYFYSLKAGEVVATHKMVLLK